MNNIPNSFSKITTEDFANLYFSRKTIKLLKSLSNGQVFITEKNYAEAERLQKYNMIEINEYSGGMYDGQRFGIILYRGERYLAYLFAERKKSKISFLQYAVTTIIALLALLISAITLLLQVLEYLEIMP